MKIIKKYNQYLKENKTSRTNEDFNEIDSPELETEQDIESSNMRDMPGNEPIPSEVSDNFDEEGDEEEGNQYVGNKMLKDLATKLGADIVNNSINYEGKKINFFSETEMYHVDRKKFKTADEVVSYLRSSEPTDRNLVEDEEPMMMEKRSYRKTRKFESYKKK